MRSVATEDVQLRQAMESMHSCRAAFVQTVPVRETFKSQPVWEGVVHVFDLEGHPRLRVVQSNRGKRQTPVLRSATAWRDQVAGGCCASGDRGGA